MPYFRAQQILMLARGSRDFHMLNIYIARQALHLVILLNDLAYAEDGLDGQQMDEREILADELLELETAMRDWSTIHGFQDAHSERSLTIKTYYNRFFRKRFYFEISWDPESNTNYQRLLAYDTRGGNGFNSIPKGARHIRWDSPAASVPSQIDGQLDTKGSTGPGMAIVDANSRYPSPQQKDSIESHTPIFALAQDTAAIAGIPSSSKASLTSLNIDTATPRSNFLDPIDIVQTFISQNPDYMVTYELIENRKKTYQFLCKMGDRVLARGDVMSTKKHAKRFAAQKTERVLRHEGHALCGNSLKPTNQILDSIYIVQTFINQNPCYMVTYELIEDEEKTYQFIYKMGGRVLARGDVMSNEQNARRSAAQSTEGVLRSEGYALCGNSNPRP